MPLDDSGFKFPAETKPDLSKPSLEGLSYLLRNLPQERPSHAWNFSYVGGPRMAACGSAGCAMGLMYAVWGNPLPAQLNLSVRDSSALFSVGAYKKPSHLVTPFDVADAIDRYLAAR